MTHKILSVSGDIIPTTERIYLMGDYYDAPAVYVKTGNSEDTRYIIRDCLGSVRVVSNYYGSSTEEYSFDAWGRTRKLNNWQVYAPDSVPSLCLGRGFTGHEHLPVFGLMNMNARLYDPAVGRFLSPDPHVQRPDFTQNLNRYSYALNNPLKYTDKSGELIVENLLWGLFKGWFHGNKDGKSAYQQAINNIKIKAGLFALDPNKNFFQRTWEFYSRFSWQLPQTIIGYGVANFTNSHYDVYNVEYKYGTTVLSSSMVDGIHGFTIGNYITGSDQIKAEANNEVFQHEYGHYIQSQKYGWAYLTAVGIPSLRSERQGNSHMRQPYEFDASKRGYKYFYDLYGKDLDWKPSNPLPSPKDSYGVNAKFNDYVLGIHIIPIAVGVMPMVP